MSKEKYIISNKRYLRLIENDKLGICKRLKQIDETAFIVYNTLKRKFELHSKLTWKPSGRDKLKMQDSYEGTLSFDYLDSKVLKHITKMSFKHNGDEMFREIAYDEYQTEKQQKQESDERTSRMIRDMNDVYHSRNHYI